MNNFEKPKNIVEDNFDYTKQFNKWKNLVDTYKNKLIVFTSINKNIFDIIRDPNYENAILYNKDINFFTDVHKLFNKKYIESEYNYFGFKNIDSHRLSKDIIVFNNNINKGFMLMYFRFDEIEAEAIRYYGEDNIPFTEYNFDKIAILIPITMNKQNNIVIDYEELNESVNFKRPKNIVEDNTFYSQLKQWFGEPKRLNKLNFKYEDYINFTESKYFKFLYDNGFTTNMDPAYTPYDIIQSFRKRLFKPTLIFWTQLYSEKYNTTILFLREYKNPLSITHTNTIYALWWELSDPIQLNESVNFERPKNIVKDNLITLTKLKKIIPENPYHFDTTLPTYIYNNKKFIKIQNELYELGFFSTNNINKQYTLNDIVNFYRKIMSKYNKQGVGETVKSVDDHVRDYLKIMKSNIKKYKVKHAAFYISPDLNYVIIFYHVLEYKKSKDVELWCTYTTLDDVMKTNINESVNFERPKNIVEDNSIIEKLNLSQYEFVNFSKNDFNKLLNNLNFKSGYNNTNGKTYGESIRVKDTGREYLKPYITKNVFENNKLVYEYAYGIYYNTIIPHTYIFYYRYLKDNKWYYMIACYICDTESNKVNLIKLKDII